MNPFSSSYNSGATSLHIDGVADDWMAAYVNGAMVANTSITTQSFADNISGYWSYLQPGNNTVAFMIADKAVWQTGDPGSRGSGACYNLYLVEPVVSATPFNVTPTVTVSGPSTVPSGSVVTVNGLLKNDLSTDTPSSTTFASTLQTYTVGGATTPVGFPQNTSIASITASQTITAQIAYNVGIVGPPGSQVCFNHKVTPHSDTIPSQTSAATCITIAAPTQYPIVATTGSDVHAGTSCGAGLGTTPITGIKTNAGSYGEYVVTTGGSGINTFLSNGSSGNGSSAATGYTTVCRPDLVTEAANRHPVIDYNGPVTLDLSTMSGGGTYVYRVNGPVTLHGNVTSKITIIASGTVTIDSDIKVTGGGVYTPRAVPSLGIIGAGNVNIKGAVTQVDAYIFSNGTINTCSEAVPGDASPCGNTLNVNGFLMGHKLNLNRTGLATTPLATYPIGERVTMTGQIYLNPPLIFDLPGSFNFLQSLGERPPLN